VLISLFKDFTLSKLANERTLFIERPQSTS